MMKRDTSKLLKMMFFVLAILIAVICAGTDETYASGKNGPETLKKRRRPSGQQKIIRICS